MPEIIVSDNGSQFRSHQFNQLLERYNISHVYTAIHSPQANASERVNRSILAAIKSYVAPNQRNWDESLSSISCALRSACHTAIGTSPYYLVFGQHMVTNGSTYSLLRQLEMMDDRTVQFSQNDSLQIATRKAAECMKKQFEKNEKRYNLRSTNITFEEGQIVFRRNFRQSSSEQGYNAKLAPSFVKARVRRRLGNSYYELEDLDGNLLGSYHAKDIKK